MELHSDNQLRNFVMTSNVTSMSTTMLDNSGLTLKIVRIMFVFALIVFTVCGNAMTLYGVCKMKSFRNSISNLYIASLAAADLIVGLFVMTFMMLYSLAYDERWVFGEFFCDIWQTVDFASCTVSLYSVCAIGFDRWLNLEKPLRVFKRSKYIAKRAIGCIWILPLLVWTPIVFTLRKYNGPSTTSQCSLPWRPKYLVPLTAGLVFYLPVFILSVLFIRISCVIRGHFKFLRIHSSGRTLSDLDMRSKVSNSRSPSITPLVNPKAKVQNGIQNNKQVYKPNILNLNDSKPPPPIHATKTHVFHNGCVNHINHESRVVIRKRSGTLPTLSRYQQQNLHPIFNGNQSPLAIQLMRDRLTPSPLLENKTLLAPTGIFNQPPRRNSDLCFQQNKSEKVPLLDNTGKQGTLGSGIMSASNQSMVHNGSDKSLFDLSTRKRSSVTSDTAVVFTKRLLLRKPPLKRAGTDVSLKVQHAAADFRRSSRFSVISITGPLFNRKYSVNIFTDMLPCPNMSQQIRAAKAVGVLMLFFLICWLPFLIVWPLKTYCDECVSDTVYQLSIWANYLNSAINPILYTLCSPRFQRIFRENCRCTLKRKPFKRAHHVAS